MVAYHADLWLAAATVAPVIALSHAVAAERSLRSTPPARPRTEELDGRTALTLLVQSRWPWRLLAQLVAMARGGRGAGRALVAVVIVSMPYLVAIAGFVLSGLALAEALHALTAERDVAGPGSASTMLIVSFFLVLFQVTLSDSIGPLAGLLQRSAVTGGDTSDGSGGR